MATIMLGRGIPLQVEVPEGVERSCKGALHLMPLSTRTVTQAELDAIRKHPQAGPRTTLIEEAASKAPAPPVADVEEIRETAPAQPAQKSGKRRE